MIPTPTEVLRYLETCEEVRIANRFASTGIRPGDKPTYYPLPKLEDFIKPPASQHQTMPGRVTIYTKD